VILIIASTCMHLLLPKLINLHQDVRTQRPPGRLRRVTEWRKHWATITIFSRSYPNSLGYAGFSCRPARQYAEDPTGSTWRGSSDKGYMKDSSQFCQLPTAVYPEHSPGCRPIDGSNQSLGSAAHEICKAAHAMPTPIVLANVAPHLLCLLP
jgi:hypothetical protein